MKNSNVWIAVLTAAVFAIVVVRVLGYAHSDPAEDVTDPVVSIPDEQDGDLMLLDGLDVDYTLWEGDSCPEPMVRGELCWSQERSELYVGVGSGVEPIGLSRLVEYWFLYGGG